MSHATIKIGVYVAADMSSDRPIELVVGGDTLCLSPEVCRKLVERLINAEEYVEDWRAWQANPDCN